MEANEADGPSGSYKDEAYCTNDTAGTHRQHIYVTDVAGERVICIIYAANDTAPKKSTSTSQSFVKTSVVELRTGNPGGWYYLNSEGNGYVACDGTHGPTHEADTSEWKKDETNHWYACKAQGCTDTEHIYNKAEHSYGESGADRYTCAVCGYVDHTKQVAANEADAPSGLYTDEAYCTNDTEGTHRQHIYVTDVAGERVICIIYAVNDTAPKKSTSSSESFVRTSVVELRTGNPGGWYCLNGDGTKYVACDGTHGPTHEADTSEWKKDETNHWHACKAQGCTDTEHIYNKAEHSYGESGAARYTCTVCGYIDRAFAGFKAQIEAITGEETVTLNKNLFAVTGDAYITIKTGQNVTIDLNGKTIDANGILCPIFVVEKNATLTIKGDGKITGVDGIYAGAVVSLQGTLNLYDATITGNKTTSNGGAIYMYDGTANFTMNSGTISNNNANYGGAIRVGKGNTFTMYGGTISGNTANKSGAIFINEGNTNLLGGSITGNTSNERGAVSTGTTVTVGGDIKITGNTTNELESNLFLRIIEKPNSKITVSNEKPLNGADIGISVDVESDEQLPKEIGTATSTDCLKTDNDHYVLKVKEGKLSLSPSSETISTISISSLPTKYTLSGTTYTAVNDQGQSSVVQIAETENYTVAAVNVYLDGWFNKVMLVAALHPSSGYAFAGTVATTDTDYFLGNDSKPIEQEDLASYKTLYFSESSNVQTGDILILKELSEYSSTPSNPGSSGGSNYYNSTGNVVVEAAVRATATTPQVAINVLKPADTVALTAAENASISSGKNVNIFVEVSDADVPAADVAAMQRVARNSGMRYGQSLDIDLYSMIVGDASTKRAITSTKTDIPVTISVPAELQKSGRVFWVIRDHDGKVDILPATYDEATQTITFSTYLFSSYAIAYSDVMLSPKTGGGAPILPIAALVITGILVVLVANRKKFVE